LAAQFARAKSLGFDAIADDCVEIADDATNDYMETKHGPVFDGEHVQRSRLRIDTRLKLLAQWDPKRYGPRTQSDVDLSVTVTVVNPFAVEALTHAEHITQAIPHDAGSSAQSAICKENGDTADGSA
jgi:hypothetical protein